MNFNPDDPKYTAFVVGELNDAERAALESELQSSPQAAALVAEIRAATDQISAALKAEQLLALLAVQRDAVLGTLSPGGREQGEGEAVPSAAPSPQLSPLKGEGTRRGRRIAWATATAVSLLLAVGAGWMLRGFTTTGTGNERQTAQTNGLPWGDLNLDVQQNQEVHGAATSQTTAPADHDELTTVITSSLSGQSQNATLPSVYSAYDYVKGAPNPRTYLGTQGNGGQNVASSQNSLKQLNGEVSRGFNSGNPGLQAQGSVGGVVTKDGSQSAYGTLNLNGANTYPGSTSLGYKFTPEDRGQWGFKAGGGKPYPAANDSYYFSTSSAVCAGSD